MKTVIFISGPYTAKDGRNEQENVDKAIDIANKIIDLGAIPFVPHLSHYLHLKKERPYDEWIAMDLNLLFYCDAYFKYESSPGAEKEEAYAKKLNKIIFTSLDDIEKWCNQ